MLITVSRNERILCNMDTIQWCELQTIIVFNGVLNLSDVSYCDFRRINLFQWHS